mgnify:CR=1 FL=1
MKKEDFSGIFAYLLILAIALVFGLTVLQKYGQETSLNTGEYIGLVIGGILTGIIFNAILYELGHVLGAKIGRYIILSVSVLGLTFIKNNDKTHIKFQDFDGLTGETKIAPKQEEKPSNPTPFLWFPTLFIIIELLIVVVLFIVLNQTAINTKNDLFSNIAYFLLILGVIGGMIWVYNILPLRLDTMTDGYRMTLVSNPKNKEAFNELLRVEHEIEEGNTNVDIKVFTEITNFTAELNLNKVYVLLEKKEYLEAEKLLDIILTGENELSEKVFTRAKAQKIYINIITRSLEDAKNYYEANVPVSDRRLISNDISMPSIRTYLLMSGLLDRSRSECIIALNNLNKALSRVNKNRTNVEIPLFTDALDLVIQAHPDWELEDYRLKPVVVKESKKK